MRIKFCSVQDRIKILLNYFYSIKLQITSIQNQLNPNQSTLSQFLLQFKSSSISNSTSISIRMQFNFELWIQFQIPHQLKSVLFDFKSISFQCQINSISSQLHSIWSNFNFNSKHFNSTWFQFDFKSIQIRFNAIQFCFDSIQFASMKIDHLRPGRVPASRQAENYNSSKGFIIKKYWIFTSRQISIFQPFSRWQKNEHF